jgi:hypothetical protein
MIVEVGLDNTAMFGSKDPDGPALPMEHHQLLESLIRYCALVVGGPADLGRLAASIKSLPVALRKRWETALDRIPIENLGRTSQLPLSEIDDPSVLEAQWAGLIRIAILEDTRAIVLGVPSTEGCYLDPGAKVELARFAYFPAAATLQKVIALQQEDVASGTARSLVWSQRFALLAKLSKRITIFDRYMGRECCRSGSTGLAWFLNQTDSLTGSRAVTLITGFDHELPEQQVESSIQRLAAQLRSHGIQEINYILADDSAFRLAHARHIRFDRLHAILVEPGLAAFSKEIVQQTFPCVALSLKGALEREEVIRTRHSCRGIIQLTST